MATLRELKGRIGSVASSEKITGAMKMISSAKMHKAEASLRRLLPFRNQVNDIIANLLSSDAEFASPLITPRRVQRVAIVVWGSDDGLCGAYNVNIYKQLLEKIKALRSEAGPKVSIDIIAVGRKIAKLTSTIADCRTIKIDGINSKSDGKPVDNMMSRLVDQFTSGEYDRVDALYMSFKSMGRQRLEFQQLLPVLYSSFAQAAEGITAGRPYLFEPGPNAIFNTVLPLFLMSTMQEIFIQNRASEQAARVMAMQSANDNAKKLLDQLQLEYNKLRQQSITNELLDIVGGQSHD